MGKMGGAGTGLNSSGYAGMGGGQPQSRHGNSSNAGDAFSSTVGSAMKSSIVYA